MQDMVRAILAVVCVGAGIRWIARAWRGKDSLGYDLDRQSSIVQTVIGVLAILFGLAILRIPLE